MSFASTGAIYWLVRQIGQNRATSAVLAAAYLFNPMFFSLSNSFMTDAHAVGLLVISAALLVFGLDRDTVVGSAALVTAGALCGVAYLSRQQSLVVPLVVAIALAFRAGRRRIRNIVFYVLPVLLIVLFHLKWSTTVSQPAIRALSIQYAAERPPAELASLASLAGILGIQYLGLFLGPLIPIISGGWRWSPNPWRVASGVGIAMLCIGSVREGWLALTRGTWWTPSGVGGVDETMLGRRPELLPASGLLLLTVVCSCVVFLLLTRDHDARPNGLRIDHRVLLLMLSGFCFAAFTGSLAFQRLPLDRYFLPLLPLGLVATAGFSRPSKKRTGVAAVLVGLMAIWSIVGTRDAWVVTQTTLDTAKAVTDNGLPVQSLDAGASWTALKFGVPPLDPATFPVPGPFWVAFFAPGLQPEVGIALEDLGGYEVLSTVEYSSWLHLAPTSLYVIHRNPALGFYSG